MLYLCRQITDDNMEQNNREEQILVRITGQDRPGLTASIMAILAKYDAQILDIGQADIHSSLTMGILIRIDAGIRYRDPALAAGSRWIGPKDWFSGNNTAIHFGVGYPF